MNTSIQNLVSAVFGALLVILALLGWELCMEDSTLGGWGPLVLILVMPVLAYFVGRSHARY